MRRATKRPALLMWAYIAHHARKCVDHDQWSWAYLLEWASLGGKTAEVPAKFGGAA